MSDSGNAVSVVLAVPTVPTVPVREERKKCSKKFGKIVGKIDLKNRECNCKLVLLKMIHYGIICSESI